jgi:hypothetical protein
MIRRIAGWGAVIFLMYYLVTQPEAAGNQAAGIMSGLGHILHSLAYVLSRV